MVPIHESDVAENRWKVAEWTSVELWEKVEVQLRKRRRWTIAAVVLVFLALSAVPIVKDRSPKWRSLRMARAVAERVNAAKLEAVRSRKPVYLALVADEAGIQLQKGHPETCGSATSTTSETLFGAAEIEGLMLLGAEGASSLGMERITREFCFDPLTPATETKELAFALIPVKDLTDRRTDRISFVFFRPSTSEVTFD